MKNENSNFNKINSQLKQQLMAEFWSIYYTDSNDGLRKRYMNAGFTSIESAKRELDLIKKAKQKRKNWNRTHYIGDIKTNSAITIGKNWQIKKIKVKG